MCKDKCRFLITCGARLGKMWDKRFFREGNGQSESTARISNFRESCGEIRVSNPCYFPPHSWLTIQVAFNEANRKNERMKETNIVRKFCIKNKELVI